jgi:hypothetical protein
LERVGDELYVFLGAGTLPGQRLDNPLWFCTRRTHSGVVAGTDDEDNMLFEPGDGASDP